MSVPSQASRIKEPGVSHLSSTLEIKHAGYGMQIFRIKLHLFARPDVQSIDLLFPNLAAARDMALAMIRKLLADGARAGHIDFRGKITIWTDEGQYVEELAFAKAVHISTSKSRVEAEM